MTYPPNTLALPYTCEDDRCPCHATLEDRPYDEDYMAHPHETPGGWTVRISTNAGMIEDEFHSIDLNEALAAVHRAYPDAEFDPETA